MPVLRSHGTLDGGGIKRMIQEKEKQSQAETQEQGENWMQIAFAAQSENEGFARTAVAAFVSCLDPTIDDALSYCKEIVQI